MDEAIRRALASDRTIDITTTGRRSGGHRRTEMWFHRVDGRTYMTGRPGRRDWYANLVENPGFTFHLKESVAADLAARAEPITDVGRRRRILEVITRRLNDERHLEDWVANSPLVEVTFEA